MTAARNIEPTFVAGGIVGSVALTAANAKSDGSGTIGTDIFLLYTYSGPNVKLISIMPTASSESVTTNATVIRLFHSSMHSNGDTTSSANTFLLNECYVPSVTANAPIYSLARFVLASNLRVYGGHLLVTSHVAAASNSAWQITLIG